MFCSHCLHLRNIQKNLMVPPIVLHYLFFQNFCLLRNLFYRHPLIAQSFLQPPTYCAIFFTATHLLSNLFLQPLDYCPIFLSDNPDAPTDLAIDTYDKRTCNLTWKKPASDGGNAIKGMNNYILLAHLKDKM